MAESDYSQFIPNLLVGLIILILTVIIAYISSEKFKTWLNKMLAKISLWVKWLVGRWHFFLPLCIVIILEVFIFSVYNDWKIAALSLTIYMMGLLGWAVSNMRKILRNKNKSINTTNTLYLPISLSKGIGNSYLKNRYIDPPVGEVNLGGVKFQFEQDSLIFDTNEQIRNILPLENGGKQIDFQLPKPVNGVKAVYFLILYRTNKEEISH
jgi:putative effector of murein hydrolase LrgA (UPF0299 family)